MAGSVDDAGLGPVVAAARSDAKLLAGRLAGVEAPESLADRLGLDTVRLHRLLLCKTPAPSRFAEQIQQIAAYVEVHPDRLAAVFREVDAVTALRNSARLVEVGAPGLLAAARAVDDDHVSASAEAAVRSKELADQFWARTPDRLRGGADLDAAVVSSLPLALVTMSGLTLAGVRAWLGERGIRAAGGQDARLRGFLVAWRGVGLLFCDGTLDAAERRFTIAHEVGHFVLDYEQPRRRVLRDAPELLEVVDGAREATAADRTRALLARAPLGLHTHALGGEAEPVAEEDEASRFALELLAPWDELLNLVRHDLVEGEAYRMTVARITASVADRFTLPEFAARARTITALDALGVRPGFFER